MFYIHPWSHQPSFPHLQTKLGLPPGVAGAELGWSGVILQNLGEERKEQE